mmetsp:Transcript_20646/g.31035  ORF Transcript_20646/g.31035 Transcript_20646/m.31035 type:complete len:727 (+) Transcript_20646:410-2590(+)
MSTFYSGLKFLRLWYSIVALFWTGFLVVFSIEFLLFLFLDMTHMGEGDVGALKVAIGIGLLVSFPTFIFGVASALVLAGQFVSESWNGHLLLKQLSIGYIDLVLIDWFSFVIYIGAPVFTIAGCILAGVENWWEITILVWFTAVSIFYTLFSVHVVVYELKGNADVTRNYWKEKGRDLSHFPLLGRMIPLRQAHVYGGIRNSTYLVRGKMENSFRSGRESDQLNVAQQLSEREMISSGKTLYCHIVSLKIFQTLGMFQPLSEPKRLHTNDEVQDAVVFVTRHTWSMEAVYCRPSSSPYVAAVGDPQALTKRQIRSSIVCASVAELMYTIVVAAFFVWLGLTGWVLAICILLFSVSLIPSIRKNYLTMKILSKQLKDNQGDDADEGVFQVWESHRVTTPTKCFRWVLFAFEHFFLLVWPVVSLVFLGNVAILVIFVIVSMISLARSYLTAAVILEETGRMDLIDGKEGTPVNWVNKSRLNVIVTKITKSHNKTVWANFLTIFFLVFFALHILALGTTSTGGSNAGGKGEDFITYLPDYEYRGNGGNTIPYPTCTFGSDSVFRSGDEYTRRDLADYVFLTVIAYLDENVTQSHLDQWFDFEHQVYSPHKVFDNNDAVLRTREKLGSDSSVVYKAISFPTEEDKSSIIVTIRGSQTAWDFLTDAQLWTGAVLFQSLRFFLPFGQVWTPLFPWLIWGISYLESSSLSRISFYKETTRALQYLQQEEFNID